MPFLRPFMQAMIFSAGLGTRFKPWTDTHPKALAIINNKSLLQRNVEYLLGYGIKDVIVNVHHFADQIEEAIQKNKGWGSCIQISDERNEVLETGGGLLKAKHLFQPGKRFLTTNVDILTDLNISRLITYHEENKALITFGITNRKTSRYLLFDQNNRMLGWKNEKTREVKMALSSAGTEVTPMAYSCVAVFEYDIFRLMEENGFDGKFSLIDVYLSLAKDHLILGYDHTGDRFVDVGKPESIAVAEKLFP